MLSGRFRTRSILVALVVIQLVIAVVAVGRARAGRTNDPELPATTPNPGSIQLPLTVESAVVLGETQADAWLPDAKLLNVTMQVDWPSDAPVSTVTSLPPGGWVAMSFVAPWEQDEAEAATLGIYFDRVSGNIFAQSQAEWPSAPPPRIAIPEKGINSKIAVLAVELAGGTALRAECPDERNRTRVTLTTEPGSDGEPRLVWFVNYLDSRNRNVGYRVIIDVESGNILRKEDNRVACSEET